MTALKHPSKVDAVKELAADEVIPRGEDVLRLMGEESVDLVVDNVAGEMFPLMLKLLWCGGRYACFGAIAGPLVSLNIRDMYLKDLSPIGTAV